MSQDECFFLEASDGSIAFTEAGRRELAPYFAMAGIDILTIKTKKQYLEARAAASPYFLEHLLKRVNRGEKTLERRALIAVAEGDQETFERILNQLKTRKILTVL